MSVSRFRDAVARRAGQDQDEQRGSSGRSGGSSGEGPSAKPLVPGFGSEVDLDPPLKFGEWPPDRDSGGASSRRSQTDDRSRRWAEGLMRRYDRNRNQRLEEDEWSGRWGEFDEVDRNHDGRVSADELARGLQESRRRGFGNRSGSDNRRGSENRSGSDSPSGSSRSGSGSDESDQPGSYRLLTPIERRPEGLPTWFDHKDTNRDGQVAMSEYESPGSWTTAAVAQFARYDLNNDGMITPQECLKVEKGAAMVRLHVGGQVARADRAPPTGRQRPGRAGERLFPPWDQRAPQPGARPPGPAPPPTGDRQPSANEEGSDGLWEGWGDE